MNKRLVVLTSAMAVVLVAPTVALAQNFNNVVTLAENFQALVNVLTITIIALALLFFFWGMAVFIMSAGDETKRAQGKSFMIWGAIGFAVMVGIWGIVNFLLGAFGLQYNTVSTLPNIPKR